MTEIEACIKTVRTPYRRLFVFPSRIVAQGWLRQSLSLLGVRTVPGRLCLSWDEFKKRCFQCAPCAHRTPISEPLRLLFAHSVVQRNARQAAEGRALFCNLKIGRAHV